MITSFCLLDYLKFYFCYLLLNFLIFVVKGTKVMDFSNLPGFLRKQLLLKLI